MPSDKEHCSIKIKLVSDDISQIRLDFLHFSLVRRRGISLINGHLIRSLHLRQMRLFFNFFLLHYLQSQPNRMTGTCESDVFSIEGGIIPFVLCGQNSGQHSKISNNTKLLIIVIIHIYRFQILLRNPVFYDVGSPKARAENQELKINVNLNKRSVSTRMWEIRISQIPFSSKAPSGCLQHFTGIEGKYLFTPFDCFV